MSEDVVVRDKDIWTLGIAFGALTLAVLVLIVSVIALLRQSNEFAADAQLANQTHTGLCAFRHQLKQQVQTSEQYLQQHPEGAPALHLSAASIQQSIDREQATISSLSALDCSN